MERTVPGLTWRKSSYSSGSGDACVEVAIWRKSSYSSPNGNACVEVAAWRKSSYSDTSGNACVEVADADRLVLIRDTTDRGGFTLSLSCAAWSAFLTTLH